MISTQNNRKFGYIEALLTVLICTALSRLMLPRFESSNVVMIYLLGVVVTALRCGRGPALISSILSVAAFDFFCVPPYFTFAVSDGQFFLTLFVMLFVAIVISGLTARVKEQGEAARVRELSNAVLYSFSHELSGLNELGLVAHVAMRHAKKIFDGDVGFYLTRDKTNFELIDRGDADSAVIDGFDVGIARWAVHNKKPAGADTDALPGSKFLYLPTFGSECFGVLVAAPRGDAKITSDQRRLLETFARSIGTVVENIEAIEDSQKARIEVRSEQLRNSLLSSVSHDLRTPLATISGAASSIIDSSKNLSPEDCKGLAEEIYFESIRMNRLVSNLLDMTKLQSGTFAVAKELQSVDEIVGSAVSYIEPRTSHVLRTFVPSGLPFVSVDPILIEQVLVNLIENADKYSPPDTSIDIFAKSVDGQDFVTIEVADRGPGVSEENRQMIFTKFFRASSTGNTVSGAGLGLAICKGIVEAHGGKITVDDRDGGGSSFRFTIPASAALPELIDED